MAYRSGKSKLTALGIIGGVMFIGSVYMLPKAQDTYQVAFVFALIITPFVYLFFGGMIADMVQSEEDKTRSKENQKAYEKEQERQREYEKENYKNQLARDMERKRMELEIEFEHYAKMAQLNAVLDEGKLRKIAQMKNEFEKDKRADLDSLNAQIQRMKREL